jgi:hypothetical protein
VTVGFFRRTMLHVTNNVIHQGIKVLEFGSPSPFTWTNQPLNTAEGREGISAVIMNINYFVLERK